MSHKVRKIQLYSYLPCTNYKEHYNTENSVSWITFAMSLFAETLILSILKCNAFTFVLC